ncbi:T9SS type A sorting domain-containing protein [bacterium]|nr:T9SS type A sorting domain-containing protein [bacterium]
MSTSISHNGNGTSNYSFVCYISTTSGGGKSVNINIYCGGGDTLVSTTCESTSTTPTSVSFGPYTINTCSTQLYVDWYGYTNSTCGGSSCSGSSGTPVPVSWIDSRINCEDGHAMLQWETASEWNNKGFEIQQKVGENEYHTLGYVAGKGQSHEVQSYSFDLNLYAVPGAYYRVKQVDYSGNTSYTKDIKLNCAEKEIYIYPNPANNSVNFSEEVHTYRITDAMGKEVLFGTMTSTVDLEDLESGFYFISYEIEGVWRKSSFIKAEN